MKDEKHFENRNLEDHIGEEFTRESSEGKWYGKDIETKSKELADGGEGKEVIIRMFEYRYPPKAVVPTKEQIFTKEYMNFLKSTLYFTDELELIQEPKVVFEKKGFKIFCTCQAKRGSLILQRPRTLQEIVTPKK